MRRSRTAHRVESPPATFAVGGPVDDGVPGRGLGCAGRGAAVRRRSGTRGGTPAAAVLARTLASVCALAALSGCMHVRPASDSRAPASPEGPSLRSAGVSATDRDGRRTPPHATAGADQGAGPVVAPPFGADPGAAPERPPALSPHQREQQPVTPWEPQPRLTSGGASAQSSAVPSREEPEPSASVSRGPLLPPGAPVPRPAREYVSRLVGPQFLGR